MAANFWETHINFWHSTYYQSREDFVSRDSVFKSWVLVAPESGEFMWSSHNDAGQEIGGHAAFGDLVCIAPNRPFFRRAATRLTYCVLQWDFMDESGDFADVLWPTGVLPVRDTIRLKATLELLKPLAGKSGGWSLRRQNHLLEELLHLAWQTRNERRITDGVMRQAAKLLNERAGESFSMRDISDALGLGPVQFTRRFRAVYGQNPIEFVTDIRLERSQKMLIETDAPLDEIAFRCGWASGAYLSHVFKKRLQITPGHFRKRHRV